MKKITEDRAKALLPVGIAVMNIGIVTSIISSKNDNSFTLGMSIAVMVLGSFILGLVISAGIGKNK